MDARSAAFIFAALCAVIALLLLSAAISELLAGCLFAATLALFGVVSAGFRKHGAAR